MGTGERQGGRLITPITGALIARSLGAGPLITGFVFGRFRGREFPALADFNDEFGTIFTENLLHAFCSVALIVKQDVDAAQQIQINRSVIAPAAGTAHWANLTKHILPMAQHMLRYANFFGRF